ncbi:Cytochrome P450 82C4 [Acorus gramineus]|uniref:Cytochrome P450 82C4 n=1 Tax=Acorus gramineus TaxID=55184 RepID=A0AAV9AF64_ACOGR|nr:Cytochrome P450 82C4 [Acorus gramineus]
MQHCSIFVIIPKSTTDTEISNFVKTQLVAGVDSMASTLVWAITLLLTNPTHLSQAQHELDTHVGRDTLVTESHLPNLPFLQALIKETLRLYPVGPLLVPHQAMEDCTVSSYHIPRGTGLFINAWAIQRDPDVWSDPDQFEPSRFLEGGRNEGVDMRGRDFELLPFGSGRRSCPGAGVAQQVMQLTLARVLQAFNVGEVPGVGVDVEEGLGILLYKLNPLRVRLTPRLPAHLYQ